MSRHPHPAAPGTVYLLHYSSRTRAGRQHYLGWTGDIERRVAQHRAGRGGRETSKAVAEGLKLALAQTWKGTPALEERLKDNFAHSVLIDPLDAGGQHGERHAKQRNCEDD